MKIYFYNEYNFEFIKSLEINCEVATIEEANKKLNCNFNGATLIAIPLDYNEEKEKLYFDITKNEWIKEIKASYLAKENLLKETKLNELKSYYDSNEYRQFTLIYEDTNNIKDIKIINNKDFRDWLTEKIAIFHNRLNNSTDEEQRNSLYARIFINSNNEIIIINFNIFNIIKIHSFLSNYKDAMYLNFINIQTAINSLNNEGLEQINIQQELEYYLYRYLYIDLNYTGGIPAGSTDEVKILNYLQNN